MFSRKCVCKLNISKIVRPLLAALSVNGLMQSHRPPSKDIIYLDRALLSYRIVLNGRLTDISMTYIMNTDCERSAVTTMTYLELIRIMGLYDVSHLLLSAILLLRIRIRMR